MYKVTFQVCDESSLAGGNWTEECEYFLGKEYAIIYAKSLSSSYYPIQVIKEKVILEIG